MGKQLLVSFLLLILLITPGEAQHINFDQLRREINLEKNDTERRKEFALALSPKPTTKYDPIVPITSPKNY